MTAGVPVLAFGRDRRWIAHLQRSLAPRGDLQWCGVFTPEGLPEPLHSQHAIWLVDGDDVRVHQLPPPEGQSPRIYFHRLPDVAELRQCARVGGSGCLAKQVPPEVLLHAIRAVQVGLFAVDPALLARALAAERRSPAPVTDLSHLTERQREIVHWAAMGMSNKQIGRRLGISPETVKSHLHQVFAREGVSGRVALLALHGRKGRASDETSRA